MKCTILAVLLTSLSITRTKSTLLDGDEASDDFLEGFLSLDKNRYLADLQELQHAAIEIDLIDGKKHQHPQQEPKILYQMGDSEADLPECSDRSEVCSKVDLYGAPWVERQCRCPGGRTCPNTLHADDGYTILDKTRQYKLCEPVKRFPICRYFKDITWTLVPGGGPVNETIQRVHCRCKPTSVPYLVKRQSYTSPDGKSGFIYAFACSPQSKIRCQHKEPCRLFTVRKRRSTQLEEVTASPLCQCQKSYRCPRRHTDPGSLPTRSYSGALQTKTYSGYCVPSHHTDPTNTL